MTTRTVRITMVLDFPPSANTYYRTYRGRAVLSEVGRQYKAHVKTSWVLLGYSQLSGRISIEMQLQAPTKRKYDIDNRIKPLLDALQDAGVFHDDEAVDDIHVMRGPIIKDGMCVVDISEIENV